MAIGGERVLTVPAPLGYGKRGSGKEIPPNSTLIFGACLACVEGFLYSFNLKQTEVKLLEIK